MLNKDRLLHPATIIATIALLVALSGAGYAATKIGTAQLKNGAVSTPKIKTNAVTAGKIKANAVTGAKLAANAVTGAKLAANAVTGAKLAANAVTGADLANDSVTAAKIAGGAVGTSALATGAVDAAKLGNGSVTNEKLGPNAVTGAKIAGATVTAANIAPGQVVKGNGELFSARLSLGPAPAGNTVLLTLPNIANVQVDCTATGAATTVNNTSGTILTATVSSLGDGTGPVVEQIAIPAGGFEPLTNGATGGVQRATWQLSYGTGAAVHVATVTVSAGGTATPGTGCDVTGQAVTTN